MDQINSVFNRAINILKSPQTELTNVKSEQISKDYLIKQYIAVLALIPAVAYIIGWGLVGTGFFKYSIQTAVVGGIFQFILSIVGVYILGIVINTLAPNFASKQNEDQAMKLAAYSSTAGLVGGIFNIIPLLGWISFIFVLYGLYILYLGIPVLMETPQANALSYTIVTIVVMIVIYLIIGAIVGSIMLSMSPIRSMML